MQLLNFYFYSVNP